MDGEAHIQIEIYRSMSLNLIGEAKVEIDLNFEVVVREYRVKVNLDMDDLLLGLALKWKLYKADQIKLFDNRKADFLISLEIELNAYKEETIIIFQGRIDDEVAKLIAQIEAQF